MYNIYLHTATGNMMDTERYDEIMNQLEKELVNEIPDMRRIKQLLQESNCPHLLALMKQRLNNSNIHIRE